MSTDLAPKSEPAPPSADAWEEVAAELNKHHFNVKGRISQAEIDRLEAEFFAAGGQIQTIPTGVSGEDSSQFNNRIVNRSTAFQRCGADPHTPDEKVAHECKRLERIYSGDSDLVAKIAVALPTIHQKKDLAALCDCSDDRVQRILRTYFSDDPLARPFLRNSRGATSAQFWNNPSRPATREAAEAAA